MIYLSHKQTRERGVDVLDEFWYGLEQFTLSVNHMSVTFFLYTRVHEVRPSQCSAAGQSFLRDGLLYLSRYQDLPLTFFSPSPPQPQPLPSLSGGETGRVGRAGLSLDRDDRPSTAAEPALDITAHA